jgi:integrase
MRHAGHRWRSFSRQPRCHRARGASWGVVNTVWNAVCRVAQVEGRTPHSARHAMGKHIMAKTGNVAAIQRQLGHRQAAYAMQYARVTTEELVQVLDER